MLLVPKAEIMSSYSIMSRKYGCEFIILTFGDKCLYPYAGLCNLILDMRKWLLFLWLAYQHINSDLLGLTQFLHVLLCSTKTGLKVRACFI